VEILPLLRTWWLLRYQRIFFLALSGFIWVLVLTKWHCGDVVSTCACACVCCQAHLAISTSMHAWLRVIQPRSGSAMTHRGPEAKGLALMAGLMPHSLRKQRRRLQHHLRWQIG
jgi:hypothetical protein